MKLCIPALEDRGLRSPVCGHFGSAPLFVIMDTADRSYTVVRNDNAHHAHGMCHPLRALHGHSIDAIVCAGIGAGALAKLAASGIKAYRAGGECVDDVAQRFAENAAAELSPETACAGHGCHERTA